jgi:hypothetical protein
MALISRTRKLKAQVLETAEHQLVCRITLHGAFYDLSEDLSAEECATLGAQLVGFAMTDYTGTARAYAVSALAQLQRQDAELQKDDPAPVEFSPLDALAKRARRNKR